LPVAGSAQSVALLAALSIGVGSVGGLVGLWVAGVSADPVTGAAGERSLRSLVRGLYDDQKNYRTQSKEDNAIKRFIDCGRGEIKDTDSSG
jgi:hypothetical protein